MALDSQASRAPLMPLNPTSNMVSRPTKRRRSDRNLAAISLSPVPLNGSVSLRYTVLPAVDSNTAHDIV